MMRDYIGRRPDQTRHYSQTKYQNPKDDKARKERERFARSLTRSLFGRHYWDDHMIEELAADRKRKRKT